LLISRYVPVGGCKQGIQCGKSQIEFYLQEIVRNYGLQTLLLAKANLHKTEFMTPSDGQPCLVSDTPNDFGVCKQGQCDVSCNATYLCRQDSDAASVRVEEQKVRGAMEDDRPNAENQRRLGRVEEWL